MKPHYINSRQFLKILQKQRSMSHIIHDKCIKYAVLVKF